MKAMRITTRVLTAAALIAATTSCGSVVRDGRSPVILVVDSVLGIRGAVAAGTATSSLNSDVFSIVTTGGSCSQATPCPTVFADNGQAGLHLALKDIGLPGATTPAPSSNNSVTITRVRVSYRRTDGRNQEGVDVPFAFDTASTATIPSTSTVTMGFPLVRVQAKQESPLVQLRTGAQVLSMIADVTFYGQDLVGNAVSATGSISIDFANFGDQ